MSDAGEARIAQGQAEGALDGTLEAQALLDEVRDRLGIASSSSATVGLLAENPHSRGEQARRRLLPGGEDDGGEADDVHHLGELSIGEPDAGQPAHDVVARRSAALLDVAAEVGRQVREHLIASVPALEGLRPCPFCPPSQPRNVSWSSRGTPSRSAITSRVKGFA